MNSGVRTRKKQLQFVLFNRSCSDLSRYKSGHQGAPRSKAELEEVHRGDERPDRRWKERADRATEAALRAIPASLGVGSELRWFSRSWGFTWVVLARATVAGGRRSACYSNRRMGVGVREREGKRKNDFFFLYFFLCKKDMKLICNKCNKFTHFHFYLFIYKYKKILLTN